MSLKRKRNIQLKHEDLRDAHIITTDELKTSFKPYTTGYHPPSTNEQQQLTSFLPDDQIHTTPEMNRHDHVQVVRHHSWHVAIENTMANEKHIPTHLSPNQLDTIPHYTCYTWFHVPLRLTPQYWARHQMTRENVQYVLKKYTHPRVVWQMILCEGMTIPNSAVKISNSSQSSFTMFGKSSAIDMLLTRYAHMWTSSGGANMYYRDATLKNTNNLDKIMPQSSLVPSSLSPPLDVCEWPFMYQTVSSYSNMDVNKAQPISFKPFDDALHVRRAPRSSSLPPSSSHGRQPKSRQKVHKYVTSVEMDNTRYPMPIHRVPWSVFKVLYDALSNCLVQSIESQPNYHEALDSFSTFQCESDKIRTEFSNNPSNCDSKYMQGWGTCSKDNTHNQPQSPYDCKDPTQDSYISPSKRKFGNTNAVDSGSKNQHLRPSHTIDGAPNAYVSPSMGKLGRKFTLQERESDAFESPREFIKQWLGKPIRRFECAWQWRGIFIVPYRGKQQNMPLIHVIRVLPWKWYWYWKGRPQSLTHCPDLVYIPRQVTKSTTQSNMDDYWITLDEQFMMALDETDYPHFVSYTQ